MQDDEEFLPYDFDYEEDGFKDEPQIRPRHVIATFLSTMFCLGVLIAIQDLSFQVAADDTGSPTTSYGLYLGTIDIPSLLFCILLGSFISDIGSKRLFIMGLLIRYISCLVFGALGFISDGNFFMSVSFVSQAIGGLGRALINMGALTTIMMFFEEHCWFLIALCESMYHIGYVLVPAIFGFQVNLNHVFVPFLILAFVVFVFLILSYIYLPNNHFLRDITISRWDTILSSVIHFRTLIIPFGAMAVSAYLGFLAVSFEQSVKSLSLSSHEVGGLFAIPCLTLAIFTPLWGLLLDRDVHPLYFMLSGSIIATVGIAVFGPPPDLPLKNNLFTAISGLFAFGVGASGLFLPSLAYMKSFYCIAGYPNDPTAHGLISSVFLTMAAVGGILGPAVGAVFIRQFDFLVANCVFFAVYVLVVLTVIVLIIVRKTCGREHLDNPDNYLPDEYKAQIAASSGDRLPTFRCSVIQHETQSLNDGKYSGRTYRATEDHYDADIEERSSSDSRPSN